MNVESLQIISKFMNDYEYEKAMELCDELLEKDNDNSHLWALKGCCLNHFEKYVEAMECYNRSLSVDDENPFIWFHVGKILMEYDLFDDALECFNNSLEINPADDMALYSKGECLMFKKSYTEAITCFDLAIGFNPKYLNAWLNKGLALKLSNNFKEALECFDKVLFIDHNSKDALYFKADCYFNLGDLNSALKCCNESLSIGGDYLNSEILLIKSVVLMDLGEYSSVIEAADIALENNPDDYDLKMLKAQALAFAGKYMEALWLVEELINENHGDMELWKLIEYIKMHI